MAWDGLNEIDDVNIPSESQEANARIATDKAYPYPEIKALESKIMIRVPTKSETKKNQNQDGATFYLSH